MFCKLCFISLHFIIYKYVWLWDFLIMQIKFCKFWHCDMHNWFMFCKFVIKNRHLSIKIIYTDRTGQMIVLYNYINSNNPNQKPDYNYAFYLYITRIYSFILYFSICTFGQCVIYSPGLFYPFTGGYFTF